jgi:hypothetical protein
MDARPWRDGTVHGSVTLPPLPAGEASEPDQILHGLVAEWAPAGRLARSVPVGGTAPSDKSMSRERARRVRPGRSLSLGV